LFFGVSMFTHFTFKISCTYSTCLRVWCKCKGYSGLHLVFGL
jgi:hypothetical protein